MISSFLGKCSGIMVLIDAARAESGDSDEDFNTMKLISYLCELSTERNLGWQGRPVALVFTKADQCAECFDDPTDFARRHTMGLMQQCRELLKRHRFFAVGVAGGVGIRTEKRCHMYVPLRIEPRGIVEPFQWLLEQIDSV